MILRAPTALNKFIERNPGRVLDVGSGGGEAASLMRSKGLEVITIDLYAEADYKLDYMGLTFSKVNSIWCAHVLEHCPNVGEILTKFKRELKPGGLLGITVPPLRHKLVGGHVNNFTPATLIYNLILAGFDCSDASIYVDDPSEISVLVANTDFNMPAGITSGPGDIEKLSAYFPVDVYQAVDGRFETTNWDN